MILEIDVVTKRGAVLEGALFRREEDRPSDTVMIAVTGIHGNFFSNPFYYNIGDTLNGGGIDFIYAPTCDAFSETEIINAVTGKEEIIGSRNERFVYTDEDIEAYLDFALKEGYKHIILAGHSLGANKVIYYLSRHNDCPIEHFFLLSPANLDYMMSGVTEEEKAIILRQAEEGRGDDMLPFPFMGWVRCTANTAYDWQFSGLLNNAPGMYGGDYSQLEEICHTGALLVGTYDNFTDGAPSEYLRNLNSHMPTEKENSLLFIEDTGHTYQRKRQEAADCILKQLLQWREA